jgi:hypothetical protein
MGGPVSRPERPQQESPGHRPVLGPGSLSTRALKGRYNLSVPDVALSNSTVCVQKMHAVRLENLSSGDALSASRLSTSEWDMVRLVMPFQAFRACARFDLCVPPPGRCPGLSCCGLSGQAKPARCLDYMVAVLQARSILAHNNTSAIALNYKCGTALAASHILPGSSAA